MQNSFWYTSDNQLNPRLFDDSSICTAGILGLLPLVLNLPIRCNDTLNGKARDQGFFKHTRRVLHGWCLTAPIMGVQLLCFVSLCFSLHLSWSERHEWLSFIAFDYTSLCSLLTPQWCLARIFAAATSRMRKSFAIGFAFVSPFYFTKVMSCIVRWIRLWGEQ